jgi:hypothetical protein
MKLVSYRKTLIAPDLVEALRRLEVLAHDRGGLQVEYLHPSTTSLDPLSLPEELSLRPAGREIYLRLLDGKGENQLETLWEFAVPLGLVPWLRFPVRSAGLERVFHFPGPLSILVDALHSEGRGEEAWPSLCAAAQVLSGTWRGTKPTERAVQAHLHRIGVTCGPVDGNLGPRTLGALKSVGLAGKTLDEVLPLLEEMKPATLQPREKKLVSIVAPGLKTEIITSGGIEAVRTSTGYQMGVRGPGKFIISVE